MRQRAAVVRAAPPLHARLEPTGMERDMNKILYRGWIILPTALPTTDGQWTASCDLARMEADGLEVFEGVTLQFVRAYQADAIRAACDEARRQVDNILADPLTRLA